MENYRLDIKLDLDEYYEELIYDFLCDHTQEEIKDILLREALYDKQIRLFQKH